MRASRPVCGTSACVILSVVAMLAAGCMATNPYSGEKEVSNTTKGAVIGAASR